MDNMADTSTWVLLRGLGRESGHWLEFADALRVALLKLSISAQVVCLDLPGNGYRFREKSPLVLSDAVAALREECVERGLSPPFQVVGLSMGGMTGLSWLERYPAEVAGLTMINSSLASISPFYHRMKPAAFFGLLPGLFCSRWRERAVQVFSCDLRRHDTAMLETFYRIAKERPVSAANLLRQLIAASGFKSTVQQGDRILQRVRLLGSEKDRLVDVRCSLQMARVLNVSIMLHSEAGHDLPVEDHGWVIKQLLSGQLGLTRP